MLKDCLGRRSKSSGNSLRYACAVVASVAIALVCPVPGVAGEPGAEPYHAPHGPGYAGYYEPNYYVGSRPSPPDYSYPLQIAPFPPGYYGPIPWSAAWYDYCLMRYRGFDPRTGYVTDPYGARMFCR